MARMRPIPRETIRPSGRPDPLLRVLVDVAASVAARKAAEKADRRRKLALVKSPRR